MTRRILYLFLILGCLTITAPLYALPNGDVDGDGRTDLRDVILALQIAVEKRVPKPEEIQRGDVAPLVNGQPSPDGMIDIRDAVIILRRVLGLVQWETTLTETLKQPSIAPNLSNQPGIVEVNLTAEPARLNLLPGFTTAVYTYNGQIPGPTIEVKEGDRVIIHFTNRLSEPTTVHWHGLEIPPEADGNPWDPVPPGGKKDYVFDIPPGTAGTFWYHPHLHKTAALQVAKGLTGAFIVRSAEDPLAFLPEKLIILWDNRFLNDGSIAPHSAMDWLNGREGNIFFVNGQIKPRITIRSGEIQRWRIINASSARYYRLNLPGHPFVQVGSDGGLFEKPVETKEILLAPGERAEVLVRGVAPPGSQTILQTLPYNRGIHGMGGMGIEGTNREESGAPEDSMGGMGETGHTEGETPRDAMGGMEALPLLTLQYTQEPPVPLVTIPPSLRKIIPLDPQQAVITRNIVMSENIMGMNAMMSPFLINGKAFDMDRVDEVGTLNSLEVWRIENKGDMDHPFHLHGFQFQVLDRNGVPEPFPSWKDTVNVRKGEVVRFILRFNNYPGKRLFHCHILEHEDLGMMGVLEVRPPGEQPSPVSGGMGPGMGMDMRH